MPVHPRHGGLSFFLMGLSARPPRRHGGRVIGGEPRYGGGSADGSSVSSAGPLPSVIPNFAMR
jgi:hypothetical protein